MKRLLSSPRRRRRLGWSALALVAAAAAAGTVALVPGAEEPPPDRLRPGGGVVQQREIELTADMRREITATLERFVPAAAGREDPALAWKLAGPGLRAGGSREEWLAGRMPVFPFEARDRRFRDWKPLYTFANRVGFDVLLQPRAGADVGAMAVAVEMTRQRGRWLVDLWYPSATFTKPSERPWVRGAPDYAAGGYNERSYDRPRFAESRIGGDWLFALVGAIGVLLVLPLAVWAVRRVLPGRRSREAKRRPLPPLPGTRR